MEIIARRIRNKGPALDGFPRLGFTVYRSARKGEFGSSENLYAPFYLWSAPEGAVDFISALLMPKRFRSSPAPCYPT
jgi:hypothetical protein